MRSIRLLRLLPLLLALSTLPACGVLFSNDFDGTEVFREFRLTSASEVDGEFLPDAPIEVTVVTSQAYPVPLLIACQYENVDITDDQRKIAFNERATTVFQTTLAANPGNKPGDDDGVEDRTLTFEFAEMEPGDYFIACFTVAAPENGIGRGFTIRKP